MGLSDYHGRIRIQTMLGHSPVKTTEEYYAHFSPNYAARCALQVLQGGISKEKAGENGRPIGRRVRSLEVRLKSHVMQTIENVWIGGAGGRN